MKIGKPLDFSRYEGMEGDRFILRSITDEIMYELMELSGQEYVDVYAQVAKDRGIKAERTAEKGGRGQGTRRGRGRREAAEPRVDQRRTNPAPPPPDPRHGGRGLAGPLAVFRALGLGYAVVVYVLRYDEYLHPVGGWLVLGGMALWTVFTAVAYAAAAGRRWPVLGLDLVDRHASPW